MIYVNRNETIRTPYIYPISLFSFWVSIAAIGPVFQ
jgi:hypothetical protein